MAVNASSCQMPARQREVRFLVPGEGEHGGAIDILVVAHLAAVEIRRGCKLAAVNILVAIRTQRKLDFVQRGGSRWDMTFGAGDLRMGIVQRKAGGVVRNHCEGRWFEAIQGMAGVAMAAVGALHKLPIVRVTMAIGAKIMSDDGLEIAGPMTGLATYL